MHNEKILHFIAEKIEDIKVAIFYCHSNSPLKINNTIIHTYKVDDCGNITFFINRPQQLISQFDREFPVGLNYFKKGKNYFMNIFGKARIIHDPEELAYQKDLTAEEINNALTIKKLRFEWPFGSQLWLLTVLNSCSFQMKGNGWQRV